MTERRTTGGVGRGGDGLDFPTEPPYAVGDAGGQQLFLIYYLKRECSRRNCMKT
jgi:hypothetical protein